MTIDLLDPNDTGEIPRPVGEDRTVIIRVDTGERTQRIDPRLIKAPSFDAIPRKTFEMDDTVVFHIPETIGVVADTEQLSLLGSVAGLDGELRPAAPGPFPVPLPPTPPPAPKPSGLLRRFFHRPRHAQPAPLWTRVVLVVGGAMAAGGGLGVAIIWAVAR